MNAAASGSTSTAGPRPRPLGTLLYVPLLYGAGWILARPLLWLAPGWRPDQVDLAGVAIALVLLVCTLPRRLRRVWGDTQPWQRLGLAVGWRAGLRAFSRGLLKALLLLAFVVAVLLISGQAHWRGVIGPAEAANALVLLLAVGLAEELLFRGWLWGELELLMPAPRALLLQAALFALVHPWYRTAGLGAVGLLGGLVLLALALALQRRADGGALWGAVGLHGGLVGGWFALQAGLVELAGNVPDWLEGPGGPQPNPIGGVLGWLGLLVLVVARRIRLG